MIKTIAFDCDDTLWPENNLFDDAKDEFKSIITKYTDETGVRSAVSSEHINNLPIYGYGAKSFTFSMIETAIDVTEGKISAFDIRAIINIGKGMLHSPIELLPTVQETLKKLCASEKYKLMAITKGDLFAQEIKMERSGLAKYFDVIEVVSEKNVETYRKIFELHEVDTKSLLMVGNSIKSDILPILELGGHAAHVPFYTTWEHEKVEAAKINGKKFIVFDTVNEIFEVLEKAKNLKGNDLESLYEV